MGCCSITLGDFLPDRPLCLLSLSHTHTHIFLLSLSLFLVTVWRTRTGGLIACVERRSHPLLSSFFLTTTTPPSPISHSLSGFLCGALAQVVKAKHPFRLSRPRGYTAFFWECGFIFFNNCIENQLLLLDEDFARPPTYTYGTCAWTFGVSVYTPHKKGTCTSPTPSFSFSRGGWSYPALHEHENIWILPLARTYQFQSPPAAQHVTVVGSGHMCLTRSPTRNCTFSLTSSGQTAAAGRAPGGGGGGSFFFLNFLYMASNALTVDI